MNIVVKFAELSSIRKVQPLNIRCDSVQHIHKTCIIHKKWYPKFPHETKKKQYAYLIFTSCAPLVILSDPNPGSGGVQIWRLDVSFRPVSRGRSTFEMEIKQWPSVPQGAWVREICAPPPKKERTNWTRVRAFWSADLVV